MKGGRPPLPLEEAVRRPLKVVRLAASTSFSEAEIHALDELLSKLRRGADVRQILRSPAIANVMKKVETMKQTLERQRERREAKGRVAITKTPVDEAVREMIDPEAGIESDARDDEWGDD